MFSQNFNDFIDHNVSQSLNNELNNYLTMNQETNLRYFSFILEMKKKIAKSEFQPEKTLYDTILTKKETDTWFDCWINNMYAFSEDEYTYYYNSSGNYINNFSKRNREEKYYKMFFLRYLQNLGLVNNRNNKNEISNTLSLGLLEQYFTPEIEEKTIPLESIPQREIFNFRTTNSAGYFLAKDKNNKNYYVLTRKYGTSREPYRYIDRYTEKINPLWFKPSNEFSDINISIMLNTFSEEKQFQWPTNQIKTSELNDLQKKAIELEDSGKETTKTQTGSLIKQWIYTNNDPYIIAGMAQSKYDSMISFTIYMVFPILLAYAILLLMILTGFISGFISKPINIYKKAIKKLNENHYGITINSFSKDEFDNITKAFNEMSIAIKQKEQIKRYVSEKLVESVDTNEIQKAGEGKIEKVTILSSDIRNFTGISEIREPSEIVEMLNAYFTKMQQAISANGGIIDKYIGDAIQAVFYDEPDKESQVLRAAKAAADMRKALEEFNKEREESGLFTIQNGIGIDTDYAITGTIGTEKGRKDFSVNGDVITRAANLEAKTKLTQSKILLSKSSVEELDCHIANYHTIKTNHPQQQSQQITFKDFDEDSVELIDVKE